MRAIYQLALCFRQHVGNCSLYRSHRHPAYLQISPHRMIIVIIRNDRSARARAPDRTIAGAFIEPLARDTLWRARKRYPPDDRVDFSVANRPIGKIDPFMEFPSSVVECRRMNDRVHRFHRSRDTVLHSAFGDSSSASASTGSR